MSRNERVVLALGRVGERTQSLELTVGVKTVATTGEDLMRIGLVSYVPNEFVVRRVKDIMQGNRQFDRTQR